MGSPRSDSKRAKLDAYLATLGESRAVDLAEWNEARRLLDPISAAYLRTLLRRSGHALAPLIEGVRHDTFANFDRTLCAMPGDRAARELVIESKQRLRWQLRKADGDRRAELGEMLLWTQTWLENQPLFATWRGLRRKATGSGSPLP